MFAVDAFQQPWLPTLGRLRNFGRADVVMVELGASVSVEDARLDLLRESFKTVC